MSKGVPKSNSFLTFEVAGKTYPLTRSPHCRVCRSPFREAAERQVLAGASFAEAARSLPDDADLTAKNISRHCRRHLPLKQEAARRLVDAAAGRRAADVEHGVAVALDELGFATIVMNAAMDRTLRGEIRPTIAQGLRAACLLAKWDEEMRREKDLAGRLRERGAVITAILGLAKSYMTSAGWKAFLDDMHADWDLLRPYVPFPGQFADIGTLDEAASR